MCSGEEGELDELFWSENLRLVAGLGGPTFNISPAPSNLSSPSQSPPGPVLVAFSPLTRHYSQPWAHWLSLSRDFYPDTDTDTGAGAGAQFVFLLMGLGAPPAAGLPPLSAAWQLQLASGLCGADGRSLGGAYAPSLAVARTFLHVVTPPTLPVVVKPEYVHREGSYPAGMPHLEETESAQAETDPIIFLEDFNPRLERAMEVGAGIARRVMFGSQPLDHRAKPWLDQPHTQSFMQRAQEHARATSAYLAGQGQQDQDQAASDHPGAVALLQESALIGSDEGVGVSAGFIMMVLLEGLCPNAVRKAEETMTEIFEKYLLPSVENIMGGAPAKGKKGGHHPGGAKKGKRWGLMSVGLSADIKGHAGDVLHETAQKMIPLTHDYVFGAIEPQLKTSITDDTAQDVLEHLTRGLNITIGYIVPRFLFRAVPEVVMLPLKRTITHCVTRAVTHVLTPTLTHALVQSPDEHRVCFSCYNYQVDCERCYARDPGMKKQYVATYYAYYFAAFFSDYYADYYIVGDGANGKNKEKDVKESLS